jgi:hypothetical protein
MLLVQKGRYSDWLRASGSSPSKVKNFNFSILSRLTLGPTQPPIQWVQWALSPEVKKSCVYTHPLHVFMA